MPAGSGTFMFCLDYSCGLFGVHNVRSGYSLALPGKLGLSNTSKSRKTLSLPKPPHCFPHFITFRTVLDGKAAPGRG